MARQARWGSALHTAQHEAAHVVVGVALGLRLHHATIRPRQGMAGNPTFYEGKRRRASLGIMLAAGKTGGRAPPNRGGDGDARGLRSMRFTRTESRALERAAAAILATRGAAHARVTRALMAGDVGPSHVARLARARYRDG